MSEKTEDIACPHCRSTGRVQWGAPSLHTRKRRIEHLSLGFVFIEAGDGTLRIECQRCGGPVADVSATLAGWEKGRYF